MANTPLLPDRNLALELVRVTEAAAMAASRWMGRGDKEGADGAAVDASLDDEAGSLEGLRADEEDAGLAADAAADDLNPAEMARQLANLSPKAAKAVAAAAKASTEAERDAALAAVEAEDGSVNRGLLLKFLGSVDS